MEIELTVMPPSNKAALALQCRRYKEDLEELKKELRREEIKFTDLKSRETLMGANLSNVRIMKGFTDQKQKLLNSNGLNIAKLEEAKRAGYEAESYAVQSMNELKGQRDKLEHAIQNNRDIGDNLSQGSRILNGMIRRNVQNKLIMFGIAALLIVAIVVLVYIKLT
jgi:vesicle transport through interaction with t-SNAREs protein 1